MPQLSPSNDALIRSQPQQETLYLSFYQPETVFAAQVRQNFTGSAGNRVVPYANVITGTPAAILPNFYMMVGTTPGGNDLGVVRVRDNSASGTANALVVAENNYINWVSGAYLTVLNYIDVEAIYPRMVQTTINGDPINATFFKDYDIPYTNQNTVYGTFVCMGPHRAAFRDPASGLAQLYWSSSGSYSVVSGTALSFQWEFEGGTPTGSTLRDPGYVSYSTPGHYRTRLTITATGTSGFSSDFGVRFVSIYDQPDAGPNAPIVQWEMSELAGSRAQGGYSGRVKIWQPVGPNFVKDGQLVVIFSDDYYGSTHQTLGGNAENCSSIFWVGYVLKDTIEYDYKQGTVEFQMGSVSEMMKQAQGFSISCEDSTHPDTWYKLKNNSILRSLYHYLRWHTTVFNIADFQYTGDERSVQYFDTNRDSMYDALAKYIQSGIKGEVVTDRQGKIWVEIGPQAVLTLPGTLMSLGPTDWASNPASQSTAESARGGNASDPQVTERIFPEVSYVEYGGIVYNPSDQSSIAALASGPGEAPTYKGTIDHMEGMILVSQAQLNQIVGNSFAYQNSRFPEIVLHLAGAYKNMDIAPLGTVFLTIPPQSTPRDI